MIPKKVIDGEITAIGIIHTHTPRPFECNESVNTVNLTERQQVKLKKKLHDHIESIPHTKNTKNTKNVQR